MGQLAPSQSQANKDYQFNFTVNLIDGVLFFVGLSFIASSTILPLYISRLTDNPFAIGLFAAISSAGYLVPQLFTANWVQKQPLKKVIPVRIGLFHIRLPVLLLGPSAFLAFRSPELALIAFFILATWQILGTGITMVGWQDMIAKIFPVENRGRFMGLTRFFGTFSGVLGAGIAAWLLEQYEFPYGYAFCFLLAGIFFLVSWIFLAMTRETPEPPTESPKSQLEFWRHLPSIFKEDKNFRNYNISRIIATGSGISLGFMAVYTIQRWDLSDSQSAIFTTCLLLGQAVGFLLFGWLSDRKGHKIVLELGYLASVVAAGLAYLAPGPSGFYAVFAMTGISTAGMMLSGMMIVFELSKHDQRPTYIGLSSTIIGIFSALTPLLGSWLVNRFSYQVNFGVTFMMGVLSFIILRWKVVEPRKLASVA